MNVDSKLMKIILLKVKEFNLNKNFNSLKRLIKSDRGCPDLIEKKLLKSNHQLIINKSQ